MPMVTLTKTFDVTRLCKASRRRWLKFNMLLCWCVGKAASRIEEFYLSPQNGKLYKYDRLVINMVVENIKGELCFCDIAVTEDLERFNADYIHLTKTTSQTCQDFLDDDAAQEYLKDFIYRLEGYWWIFVVAVLITLVISLLSVLWQTLRAAHTNPATELKKE